MSFKMCEAIKQRIKDLGLNQRIVAEKINVNPVFLCKALNGMVNPSMDTLYKLLDALDMEIELVAI